MRTVGGPERLFLTDGGVLEVAEGRGPRAPGPSPRRPRGVRAAACRGLSPRLRRPSIRTRRSGPRSRRGGPGRMSTGSDARRSPGGATVGVRPAGADLRAVGRVVAAPTTSLPEVPGGEANWDYRYAWLRDASLIARALLAASCAAEGRRYFRWMVRAAVNCRYSEHVQIVFGAEGERRSRRPSSTTWRASPAAGRCAWATPPGASVSTTSSARCSTWRSATSWRRDRRGRLTAGFLCELVDRAAKDWCEPDAGVWEVRDRDRVHTTPRRPCAGSRWTAAYGSRTRSVIAPTRPAGPARDEVRATVLDRAWNAQSAARSRGRWTCEMTLDMSVLLPPWWASSTPSTRACSRRWLRSRSTSVTTACCDGSRAEGGGRVPALHVLAVGVPCARRRDRPGSRGARMRGGLRQRSRPARRGWPTRSRGGRSATCPRRCRTSD